MIPTTDYEKRAKEYGFASPKEIKAALVNPEAYVLDVRSPDEIAQYGKLGQQNTIQAQWKTTSCTAFECPALSLDPTQFVPNKDATIVIYCRSGRRAVTAKQILCSKGYKHVLNAGGLDDVQRILNTD